MVDSASEFHKGNLSGIKRELKEVLDFERKLANVSIIP